MQNYHRYGSISRLLSGIARWIFARNEESNTSLFMVVLYEYGKAQEFRSYPMWNADLPENSAIEIKYDLQK